MRAAWTDLLSAASKRGPKGMAKARERQRRRRARMGPEATRAENRKYQGAQRARQRMKARGHMIDGRECSAMAAQALEEAHEAREEATACRRAGLRAKADRWDRVASALTDAAEAFQRAENEIGAVGTEKE